MKFGLFFCLVHKIVLILIEIFDFANYDQSLVGRVLIDVRIRMKNHS